MRWRGLSGWLSAALISAALPAAAGSTHDLARRIHAAADHGQRPYAIVDKQQARIFVFDASGKLLGDSPVLLGAARGDSSPPDIAQRSPASLRAHERITPAGRFESEPGHNDKGEAIVWIDYDASLALHRLRPSPARERRAQRLASPTPDDNRISLGCVVVPVAFYDAVIAPLLGRHRGVVYVLPESGVMPALAGPGRWD
ncbi:MAG: L,D-transpeptidase [Burkholderiaceae bacterium]